MTATSRITATAARYVGFDGNGIRRVYAATADDALEMVKAYIRRRPDTGPLTKWVIREA